MSAILSSQEFWAGVIVSVAASWMLWRSFRKYLGAPVSLWLLSHGFLKSGFWLKKHLKNSDCDDCSCPTPKKNN